MTSAVLLYEITNGEKVSLSLKQTLYPPSLDIIPAAFRSARFVIPPINTWGMY